MATRAATRTVRDWIMDSRQWERFSPREGDIIIATAPKCGTTWTQRIVSMLVFGSAAPVPLHGTSPWIDCRFQMPPDVMFPMLEGQTHRRFVKSHLPFDALPVYENARYVHVARDGRDACMSLHNHYNGFTEAMLTRFDQIGANDEAIRAPFPRPAKDAHDFFLNWMTPGEYPAHGNWFFEAEKSYWAERRRENLLLVHYNDLKADLDGEMRRIARFLGIEVPEGTWPSLVETARFETMKAQGRELLPGIEMAFNGGHETFLYRGTNERWRGVLNDEDLARYEEKSAAALPPGLKAWLAQGRLKAGDPREMAD